DGHLPLARVGHVAGRVQILDLPVEFSEPPLPTSAPCGREPVAVGHNVQMEILTVQRRVGAYRLECRLIGEREQVPIVAAMLVVVHSRAEQPHLVDLRYALAQAIDVHAEFFGKLRRLCADRHRTSFAGSWQTAVPGYRAASRSTLAAR